jgi:protein-S-isoprenylcysteine O-methyltransferase Ste14
VILKILMAQVATSGTSTSGKRGVGLAEWLSALRATKLYDLLAAAPLIGWYAYCFSQQLPLVTQQVALAKLIAQTDVRALSVVLLVRIAVSVATLGFILLLIVLFAARRTPRAKTPGFYPRFVAVIGTFFGLSIVELPPQELSVTVYSVSLLLTLAGTAFAIYALATLGRSMSILPEARRLVIGGPYSMIRHPLYVGELVALTGIALQYLSVWALLLLCLQGLFQFERIRNEERVLSQMFPEYRDYMARTARLVPHVY